MTQNHHPDGHELDDWPLYGPKNPEIASLVDRPARNHGLRLDEIEGLILQALKACMAQEEARQPTSSNVVDRSSTDGL